METEAKKYEIGYLVSPRVEEDDVARVAGVITRVIEEMHGVVRHVNEPQKRRLAYPIEKDRLAYFGYTTFSMAPEHVKEVGKKLQFEKEVMRHLLVEEEVDTGRKSGFRPTWQSTEGMPGLKVEAPKREVETVSASPEEREAELQKLDKRLDELLGS
jgi:ribosomal protein S6